MLHPGSAFSGVQTDQNGSRSPVSLLQCFLIRVSPNGSLQLWMNLLGRIISLWCVRGSNKGNIYSVIEGGIGAWSCCACCECQELCTSQPASTPLLPLPDFEEYTVEHDPGSPGMSVKDGNYH